MKDKYFKKQLEEIPAHLTAHNDKITALVAKIKCMPQGADRWILEELVINECRVDPGAVRTKPHWSKQDWLKRAIELKSAARRYRIAGKTATAVVCEADAKVAEERAAWMA